MKRDINIVSFEPNSNSADRTLHLFLDLLADRVDKFYITQDRRVIKAEGVHVRIYIGTNESMRGVKCDYVINNVNDSDFHNMIAIATMSPSQYIGMDLEKKNKERGL